MVTASLVDFESTGDWPFFGMKIINIKKNYFDLRIFYKSNKSNINKIRIIYMAAIDNNYFRLGLLQTNSTSTEAG
jgi:hypothetical protein